MSGQTAVADFKDGCRPAGDDHRRRQPDTVRPAEASSRSATLGRAYATGKRKNAVARVWLKPGKGEIR